CNEKASNVFQKERVQYFKIQDLKAQLQDKNIAISKLKKLIKKDKGKFVDTKLDRPFVVQQPNAQRIPKPSVLEGLSKSVTAQTLPQTAKKAVSNTNVLRPGMYRIDNRTAHTRAPQLPQTIRNTNLRVSTSIGVNHKPTVSRPQLKSNQSRDKVLPNNSQVKVKKTYVEVHPRIPSVSNKMKSVTADGENLDKMKGKGDQCILVGYFTQSKGYRVYNKSTRMIVESIHIRFDEIKEVSETFVANNTSGLVPQRQKALNCDNPDPVPQRQDVYSSADADVPSQQKLNLLFGPLYDEFFNVGSNPLTNVQSTSAPSTHTNVHAEEN
nr:hypothetical protein [Tanacetum cinerariifolium]